jgi:hypothetical protein
MRYAFLIWLVVLPFTHKAQEIIVSGKVVDNESKEVLPFATIAIKGKTIGTISNLLGEFDFHLPVEMRNDFLTINMLGYKTFEAPVWSLLDIASSKPLIIEMIKSPVVLGEVTIVDTLRAADILRLAISRIDHNYPMKPFLMKGFYRDLKKLGGTYISLLEAAVKIYDEDYSEPRNKLRLRERVALEEVRRSLGYDNKFTSFFDRDNLLQDLLLHNSVRYRHFPEEELYAENLKREKDSFYNGNEIYVISHQGDFHSRLFIEKKTYGIIHLEYENKRVVSLEKKRELESKFVKEHRIIDFKPVEGKLYLSFIQVISQINWYESKTGKLKFETELQRQLLINEIRPNSQERVPISKKMKGYGLQFQDQTYNQKFWENYNVIKETPLDKKIVSDLEKELPLEKQFKDGY